MSHSQAGPMWRLKALVTVCVVVILIGIVSLVVSYSVAGQLYLWKFDRLKGDRAEGTGMSIEILRLILAVTATGLALLSGFGEELAAAFTVPPRLLTRRSILALSLLAVIGTVGVALETKKSVSRQRGSYTAELFEKASFASPGKKVISDPINEFRRTYRTYLLYIPYSAVFYGIVVPLLVAFPLACMPDDIQKAWTGRYKIHSHELSENGDLALREYGRELTRIASRYLDVFGAVATFYLFQLMIGRFTLSDSAQSSAKLACSVCALSVCCVAFVWYLYLSAWNEITERAEQKSIVGLDVATPKLFLQNLMLRRVSGYAIATYFSAAVGYETASRVLKVFTG